MSDLLDQSIADAHRLLTAGEVSSVELTEATLVQIERTDGALHAYATVIADEALAAARTADEELRRGEVRGPLHGLPVGIKDLCHMRGVLTEAGSDVLRGNISTTDAHVVQRLREGGAVIVGKTVTSEFAFGLTIRPTRNAWHQELTPSGSSAGSAVAVAARTAFASIGTDTAGSIRAPAGVNGVVGLKPTLGLVGTSGVIPMSPSMDHIGPITRTVSDCAAVLSVIAGFDPADPHSLDVARPASAIAGGTSLSGVRIGVERTHLPEDGIDPRAHEAAVRVADELAEMGATIVEVTIPELKLSEAGLVTIKGVEAAVYHLAQLRRDPGAYGQQTRAILQAGALIPATQYGRALQVKALVTHAVRATFQRHALDALLGPGWGPATAANTEPGVPFNYPMRASTVNLTGMPALNVPCGFTADGWPLGGFELWGRPLGEATILRIAAAYEAAHDWHLHVPPIARPGGRLRG